MDIIKEIKNAYKKGTILIKLIYVNVAIFLTVNIIYLFFFLFNINAGLLDPLEWLALPAYVDNLIFRPWTLITYMFLHEQFFHILFNMLFLFWFGSILVRYFGQKRLLSIYLLGGISGGILYILLYNIFPVFSEIVPYSRALGASASVMAIIVAIAVYKPDYAIHLLFLGPVKLKWIAIFYVGIDIISIRSANAGGHIAHLGGALFGFLYIMQYRKGNDWAMNFSRFLDKVVNFFKPNPKLRTTYKRKDKKGKPPRDDIQYNRYKREEQEEIDRILDKISQKGYESLTKKEKETLFKMKDK